jgi:hypothetical protein
MAHFFYTLRLAQFPLFLRRMARLPLFLGTVHQRQPGMLPP